MNKKQVAEILDEIGTLLELKGENPFKARAYHNAARTISGLTKEIDVLITSGELATIKGIGEALTEKITELVAAGRLVYYEELKKSLPPGLVEMLGIPGLGPKRIKTLHDRLKISTIDELAAAAKEHRIASLDGFGEKIQLSILEGIEQLKKHAEAFLYPVARMEAEKIIVYLKKIGGIKRIEVAGSLRRKKEIIRDIDILVAARESDAPKIMQAFVNYGEVDTVLAHGETKSSVRLKSGIQADVRIVSEKEFPFALQYFTGSKEHNVAMRSLAKKADIRMNEYGLFRGESKKSILCKSEEEVFEKLKLQYIPPELRENLGEVDAAARRAIPQLVEEDDIRGTLHVHTIYSDGVNTMVQMSAAAQAKGWEYLGIADHSVSAAYAQGLTIDRVKKQWKEIDELNSIFKKFVLLKGSEVDILADGSLDYPDRILESFDYVVVSVHSKFKMTEKDMTARIIKGLKNKYATILGHPTGRLLLSREPYPVNMIDIVNAASDYGKAIEINSHPMRLDLDWRLCRYAKEKHVPIVITPDAHSLEGLDDIAYGVGIARKGWLEKKDVANTKRRKDFVTFLKGFR
ncbi:MAG: DNA polymerase/3'-5' exonuclease PolX [Bacteroidota bacterium]